MLNGCADKLNLIIHSVCIKNHSIKNIRNTTWKSIDRCYDVLLKAKQHSEHLPQSSRNDASSSCTCSAWTLTNRIVKFVFVENDCVLRYTKHSEYSCPASVLAMCRINVMFATEF